MRRLFVPAVLLLVPWFTGCAWNPPCYVAPSITGQPVAQTVALGQPALFTVAAAGSGRLSYQWSMGGTAIQGATKPFYLTPPTKASDSGAQLTVTVSNPYGSLTSNSASLTVAQPSPNTFRFVAPNGNDENPGTIDQPYRTIQHCATTVGAGWTCLIRAGTYRETVSPNSGITIMSYNFEPVIVDGSDPVTGWVKYDRAIYRASVNLSSDDTNQVFVGNEMMTEARWPNGNDLFHVNWARERDGTDPTHIKDPDLPKVDWTGAKIHLWSGDDPFGNQTGQVTASSPGQITIDVGQTGTCPVICPIPGGYYYLFGTLAALDADREWFYDPNVSTLYFRAPGGVDPNSLDVRAKRRQYAFDLSGKSGVTIRNISIFASTILTDQASTGNNLDHIDAEYISHFTSLPVAADDANGINFSILRVHVRDSGIILNGSGNTLQNSTIAYSAGAGVALEGDGNTVRNNLIHEIDYVGDYASGIDLDGDNNIVQHNTIYNIGRQGIYVQAVVNEDISYNNMYNAMMLSRDGAEIYVCCTQSASAFRIHHNWLHDTRSLISGAAESNPLAGLMIDWGSKGLNVDQNVFWGNHRYSVLIDGITNDGANDNDIHNNTVPDSSSQARVRITQVADCSSTRVVDNRMVVGVLIDADTQACIISNNRSLAPGASEMTPSTEVGCNFSGCSSLGPAAISDDGSVSPCPVTASKTP
jgi:hypothetical protein